MTSPVSSKRKRDLESRPLDFHRWLESRGMNPNRKRPVGRTAALLMDYRAYLEKEVGKDNVDTWFNKYTGKVQSGPPDSPAKSS